MIDFLNRQFCHENDFFYTSFFYHTVFFALLTIFILHSRESELYRYVLDGMSALAWEDIAFHFSLPATNIPLVCGHQN